MSPFPDCSGVWNRCLCCGHRDKSLAFAAQIVVGDACLRSLLNNSGEAGGLGDGSCFGVWCVQSLFIPALVARAR